MKKPNSNNKLTIASILRLTVTDDKGASATDEVTITVNAILANTNQESRDLKHSFITYTGWKKSIRCKTICTHTYQGEQHGLCDTTVRILGGAPLLARGVEPRAERARFRQMHQPLRARPQLHARCHGQRRARPAHRHDYEHGRSEGDRRRSAGRVRSQASE